MLLYPQIKRVGAGFMINMNNNFLSFYFFIIVIIFGENVVLIQCSTYPFEISGAAARVDIFNHPNLLQLVTILPVEFQDSTRPGLQHNSASEFWLALQVFCHSEENPAVAFLFVCETFVSRGHTNAFVIVLCRVAAVDVERLMNVSAFNLVKYR